MPTQLPPFTFFAHSHRLNGPKSNTDTDVIIQVSESDTLELSPFILIPPETRLKVTIEMLT